MPPVEQVQSWNFLTHIPQSAVSGSVTKWMWLGTTATQPWSDGPCKMTERGQQMLRRIVRRDLNFLQSQWLQTSCGPQISSRTVCRELHRMGFHGRAAAHKPYIGKCNAKHRMQWCRARLHWTLEQWRCILWSDESRFSISIFRRWAWPLSSRERNSECFSIPRDVGQFHAPNFVGTVWGWPLPVPTWLCTSAQSKVHKDMDERVWCGWTWLACTESWPQPDRTPLGWIRVETESQAFTSNISVWPHKCASGRMVKNFHKHTPKPCGKPSQKRLKLL